MARELEAVQAERAGRSHIAPVTLVKFTTYSDRTIGTVDKVFYLSNLPCEYDYGNTGTDQTFLPIVTGGGDFISSMSHLPQIENLESFGQEFDLRLDNLTINGKRTIELLNDHNLEGATVEIAQLLLASIDSLPLDLTSFDGDEHTVLFRGRLQQVAPITDHSLTLQFRADLPSMAGQWIFATDDTKVHPEDVGKRVPRVYGSAVRFPAIAWEIGFSGTMSDVLATGTDNITREVDDTTGLPDSPTEFIILMGREKIRCTKVSATEIEIVSGGRAQLGSIEQDHLYGATWQEQIDDPVWIVSDQESDSVSGVYEMNAATGKLVRLDSSLSTAITVTVADTTTIPGRTVTSIKKLIFNHFTQHPWGFENSVASTSELHSAMDQDHSSATSNYSEISGTADSFWRFDQAGTTRATMGAVTVRIWLTAAVGAAPSTMTVRAQSSSGQILGTISSGDLVAAGSVPKLHEFTVSDPVTAWTSDSNHNIYITHSASGDARCFDCELEFESIQDITSLDQEADSVDGNAGSQANMDKVIDGSDSTFMVMTGSPEHIDVFFPSSGASSSQTINILMKSVASKNWDLRRESDDFDLFDRSTERNDEDPATWKRFSISTSLDSNGYVLNFNQSSDWGDIHRVTRHLHVHAFVDDIPQTQIFVDCDGVVAPGSGYQVSAGVVLEHPADIMKHWIEVVGGETLDSASYTAFVTALGASAKWAVDVRSLGFTWAQILQRMAYESRCNVVAVEKSTGREWKILSADSGYGFGPPTATITQTHNLTDEGRTLDDIASFFNFRYAFDASLPGGGSEEGFKLALLATPDETDVPITTTLIDNASKRFGDIDAGPIAFRAIQDTDTAKDVSGYIVQERMANDRRVFRLRDVAWFDALPLDVGDIVSIQAPWASAATTCRITSMSKGFSSHVWEITAIEVLEDGTRT